MPPTIQMKKVCKLRSTCILNTFSIDENFKGGGGGGGGVGMGVFWSRISENRKNPNHDTRKLKFAIFENFTNHGESI